MPSRGAHSALGKSSPFSLQSAGPGAPDMPAAYAIFLLATLPIGQTPYAPPADNRAAARPNRRILAPEYGAPSAQSADPPARRLQPDDARLCDVAFIDSQHGWAVGDHGVILHT